jgi:tetratricopeptide (TPR) repeat protein
MSLRRILPLLAVLFFAVACGRGGGGVTGTEQEDSDFLRAQDLKKRGLATEALAAYLKVIARRGEAAPESHLEAGLIYYQNMKEYLKAMYHLQEYLELQPASPRRESVRTAAQMAEREFVFQRLAQSQFAGGELQQLQDQVDQLTRDKARLESELKMIRDAPSGIVTRSEILIGATPGPATQIQIGPAAGSGSTTGQISLGQTQPALPAIGLPPPGSGKSNSPAEAKASPAPAPRGGAAAAPKSAAAAKPAGSTYTVRSGDTLASIARQHYNGDQSSARLNALRQANREVLKNGDKLSVGLTLRIP